MNIGIDCDGVQFNFCKAYSRVIREMFGQQYTIIENDATEVPSWDWDEWHPAGKEKLDSAWKHLQEIENFWENIDVNSPEQTQYMVNKLNNHPKINVYFITSRVQTLGRPLLKQTVNSLKRLGWTDPQVIVSFAKGALARVLDLKFFIDDRAENCAEVAMYNPTTKVFVLDKQYNRILQDKYFKIERVKDLRTFTDAVLKVA